MAEKPKKIPYPQLPKKEHRKYPQPMPYPYPQPQPQPQPYFRCDMRVLKQMYCHMKACHRHEIETFRHIMRECIKRCKPRRHHYCDPCLGNNPHDDYYDYESSSHWYESSSPHYHAQPSAEESSVQDD